MAVAGLTEALETLQTAEQSKDDFLAGLDLDNDPDTDTTEGDVNGALTTAETARDNHINTLAGSDYQTEGTNAGLDGDSINVLNGKLTDAQEALASSNEAAAEETGLTAAISAASAAQTTYQDALEAEAKAETAFDAEVAKANTLNTETIAVAAAVTGGTSDLTDLAEGDDVVTVDAGSFIVVGANGTLEAADGITTADYEGFDALLAAAQASYDAEVSLANDQEAFESAMGDVLDIENDGWNDFTIAADANSGTKTTEEGLYALADGSGYVVQGADGNYYSADMSDLTGVAWDSSTGAVAAGDVASGEVTDLPLSVVQAAGSAYYTPADGEFDTDFNTEAPLTQAVIEDQGDIELIENIIAEREELLADVEEAQGLVDQLDELNQSITDAEETLTDDEADGGFGVNLVDLGTTATSEDDLYVFSAGADTITSQFGGAGEDKIYVGDSFTRVDLESDAVFTAEQGDAGTMEVFFQQNGADAVLTFEDKAFAGNGSTDADLTEVTLTGVNVEDLSIDNGYINVA